MLGQFPESINKAIIESMDIHNEMATKLLSDELIAKGFAKLMFDVLMRGRWGKSLHFRININKVNYGLQPNMKNN